MIECPFEYNLADDELRKLGEMSLTWSHTDHTIGNSLKAALQFNDDEAMALIFPLALDARVRWLRALPARMNQAARAALDEFVAVLPALQAVRNVGVHGVTIQDTKEGSLFHLRSKDRTFTKADLFACEEFTNYCARVAFAIRYALFHSADSNLAPSWPERPAIPKVLEGFVQNRTK
jgi:hypothetical protein